DERVRRGRNDREGELPWAFAIAAAGPGLPKVVESGEINQPTARAVVPVRLASDLGAAPFEEAVGGDDATSALDCFAVGRSLEQGFSARVNLPGCHLSGLLWVLHPVVDKTPLRQHHFGLFEHHAGEWVLVRRRDVVTRPCTGQR